MSTIEIPERYRKQFGNREILELVREPHDVVCDCGQCDNGHVITAAGARHCPNLLKKNRIQKIDQELREWDFPSLSLEAIRKQEGFVSTPSFSAVDTLYSDILHSGRARALILCGGHGRSKTLSSLAMLRSLAESGVIGCAIRFPQLIAEYKRGIDGAEAVERTYQKIKQSLAVVVDELGREPDYGNRDHSRFAIQEIVSICHRKRFLILISNLSLIQLTAYLPSDVCSRLNPKSQYCTIVEEAADSDLRQETFW